MIVLMRQKTTHKKCRREYSRAVMGTRGDHDPINIYVMMCQDENIGPPREIVTLVPRHLARFLVVGQLLELGRVEGVRAGSLEDHAVDVILLTPVLARQAEHRRAVYLACAAGVAMAPITQRTLHSIGVSAAAAPQLESAQLARALRDRAGCVRVGGVRGA